MSPRWRIVREPAASTVDDSPPVNSQVAELKSMLDSIGEGLVAVGDDERVELANAVACSLFGARREELTGQKWRDVVMQPAIVAALEEAIAGRAVQHSEAVLVSEDTERIVDVRGVPRFDAQGRAGGALLVLRDVTLARRADAMRRDLLVNVSHELKTPIAALRGMVETVIDDPQMDAYTRSRFLQRMGKQCQRLSTLVTDVLALGAIEASEGGPPGDDVDLLELVAAVVGELAPSAEQSGVTVTFEPSAVAHVVTGDAELLRQAVSNLVVNAVTYSDPGDHVTIRLLARPGGQLVEVEDSGIGIGEEHLTRIFERFYRADPARSRERGGSGLGLSIVKHVAIMHGGDVSVASKPGTGSSFRLRLPLRAETDSIVTSDSPPADS